MRGRLTSLVDSLVHYLYILDRIIGLCLSAGRPRGVPLPDGPKSIPSGRAGKKLVKARPSIHETGIVCLLEELTDFLPHTRKNRAGNPAKIAGEDCFYECAIFLLPLSDDAGQSASAGDWCGTRSENPSRESAFPVATSITWSASVLRSRGWHGPRSSAIPTNDEFSSQDTPTP